MCKLAHDSLDRGINKKSFFSVSKAMAYNMDYGTKYSFVCLIHIIDNFS